MVTWLLMNIKTKVFEGGSNLKSLPSHNFNQIFLGHLNINSLRSKSCTLTQQIAENVDILMLLETKVSFQN